VPSRAASSAACASPAGNSIRTVVEEARRRVLRERRLHLLGQQIRPAVALVVGVEEEDVPVLRQVLGGRRAGRDRERKEGDGEDRPGRHG